MAENTPVVYEAKDGQQISLDFQTITKFLVQGHPEYIVPKEMVFFMGICKSRGLNPFNKDCYLMKYTQKDPAAIIIARDYKRKQAKAQKDCKGWAYGIIVERDGKIVYSKGLMLKSDVLLGGWFRAQPEGWAEPFELEVNIDQYVKRTSQGDLTRFWKKENQPGMIAKVAESQGLTACWPGEFGQMYIPEEMGEPDMFKTTETTAVKTAYEEPVEGQPETKFEPATEEAPAEALHQKVMAEGITEKQFKAVFLEMMEEFDLSEKELWEAAIGDSENFIADVIRRCKPKTENKPPEEDEEPQQDSQEQPGEAFDEIEYLRVCRPSSSTKNAQEALRLFEKNEDEINLLEDKTLRVQLLNKWEKTKEYIKDRQPEEAPQSPGAQEQIKRRSDFIDFCMAADKKVESMKPEGSEEPGLLEAALGVLPYKDLMAIPETFFPKFKEMLISNAAKREVMIP